MAWERPSHGILPIGETSYGQGKRRLLNDTCTSYLQPENGLCHVGVLEVGRAGIPGILRDTVVQVDHLSSTHLWEKKETPNK